MIALNTDTGTNFMANCNQLGNFLGINGERGKNRVPKVRQPVNIIAIQTLIFAPVIF